MSEKTKDDILHIGEHRFTSRLLLGTAAYPDRQPLFDCLEQSGTELVTVSLRRVSVHSPGTESLYESLTKRGYSLLPNTAGCFTAREAILTAKMAREALGVSLLKLEVINDEETLLPEPFELVEAAKTLVKDGFTVLPYTNDDPILAQRLEDAGCAAIMPLAAPIGTGLGIRNPHNLELIRSRTKLPVIVDAGIGTASDAAKALELGCDAVLLNTAVSRARDPLSMAIAMGKAVEAGRLAYLSGRMPQKFLAESASPMAGRAWKQ